MYVDSASKPESAPGVLSVATDVSYCEYVSLQVPVTQLATEVIVITSSAAVIAEIPVK